MNYFSYIRNYIMGHKVYPVFSFHSNKECNHAATRNDGICSTYPDLDNEDKYSSSRYHGYRCSFIAFKTSNHEAYHSSKSKMNDII